MSLDRCPDISTIEKFLFGEFENEAEKRDIEAHLERCDKCSAVTANLGVDETILQAIGNVPVDADDEPIIERAIERGKQLAAASSTDDVDATLIPGPPIQNEATSDQSASLADTKYLPELDRENTRFLNPPEQPDELGRLGGYRVLKLIGYGGMGIVFRAEDPALKRVVALKVMKPAIASSREARERFLSEARATAAIDHDNLVDIYQVGEDNGVPFLAMQFLQGQSLQDRLDQISERKRRPLNEKEILSIAVQMARGLDAAHKAGLIHRDIKPDNVWLQKSTGRVKILDFGLARVTDDPGLTQAGQILGTPRYMSPEQAEGQRVDHRSDLFSLGCVLYRLVTGRLVFDGEATTAVLLAVSRGDFVPVLERKPDANPELAKLIESLLAKDASSRPESAEVVIRLVIEINDGRTSTPTDAAVVPAAAAGGAGARQPPRDRSTALPWGAGLLLLMLALLAGGWYAYVNRDGEVIVSTPDDVAIESVFANGMAVPFQSAGGESDVAVQLSAGQYAIRVVTTEGDELDLGEAGDAAQVDAGSQTRLIARVGKAPERRSAPAEVATPALDDRESAPLVGDAKVSAGTPTPKVETSSWPTGNSAGNSRRVAEWVFSLGGGIVISAPDAPHGVMDATRVEDLPDRPWDLLVIRVDAGSTRVGEDRFVAMGRLPKLEEISLAGGDVVPGGVTHLNGLPIRSLSLRINRPLSDAEVETIARFEDLKFLSPGPQLTSKQVEILAENQSIEAMEFYSQPATDELVITIAEQMPQLKSLQLSSTKITDVSLPAISKLDQLESLYLGRVPLSDEGLASLEQLGSLRHAFLGGGSATFTREAIEKLSRAIPACLFEVVFDNAEAVKIRGGEVVSDE